MQQRREPGHVVIAHGIAVLAELYRLLQNPLPHSTAPEVWAKCDMVAVVSIDRLDLVRTPRGANGTRQYLSLSIGADQFEAIRRGVVQALGLSSVIIPPPQPPLGSTP